MENILESKKKFINSLKWYKYGFCNNIFIETKKTVIKKIIAYIILFL